MSIASDDRAVLEALSIADDLAAVAGTFPVGDERRVLLDRALTRTLTTAPAMRPALAADLLGVTERTVRAWIDAGLLTAPAHPAADPARPGPLPAGPATPGPRPEGGRPNPRPP